jgi:hypothetical protein
LFAVDRQAAERIQAPGEKGADSGQIGGGQEIQEFRRTEE